MLRQLVFAAALSVPGVASATILDLFSDVVVFGDSLSDPVNLLPPDVYPNGQVTNGNNWAVQLGLADPTKNNFAVSGATAKTDGDGDDDFHEQIQAFDDSNQTLGDSALAAVWLGGNDVAAALFSGALGPQRITDAVDSMASGLDKLSALGFDKALVFLSPDVGDTPLVQGFDAGAPGTAGLATAYSASYNAQLLNIGSKLLEPLDLAFVDIPTLALDVLADPTSFGFTNVDDACVVSAMFVNGCDLDMSDGYFYYDEFHPTERTHALVAGAALETAAGIAPIPLPAGGLLLVAAFAGLGLAARRRQKA